MCCLSLAWDGRGSLLRPACQVQAWLRRGTVLVGIQSPIEPGSVFPLADPKQVEVDTDLHFWADNYSSVKGHQIGAEEFLAKELASGWLDWSPSKGPLEKKYGPITQNRIGVIAKLKNNKQ